MQKNKTSANAYLNEPCGRCGNKRRISRKWKETVPTLTGTTIIQYSQIVCINKACQVEFDKNLLEETKKREVVRIEKEANLVLRKAKKNK